MRIVYVPIGLPGAGKTTYFKTLKNVTRIDMDKFIGCKLTDVLGDVLKTPGDIYLDGLFLSKKVQDIIQNITNVQFIYFDTTREQCLINDKKRNRAKSSANIIKNAEVHKPERSK